ncbi:MAG TPA: beta-eliminating lyase-related protein [Rhizomicrobium sp.]|nr:beta-eliminating lyase-related protein [Rhizomicrobium sp.]
MNFASDNAYGAAPEIIAALAAANEGAVPSYGEDALTKKVTQRLCEIFEREVAVYPVVTGTAANSLALATLAPPHGAIFCHAESHAATDECGAPEFFTHGAKLVALEGGDAKLTPAAIEAALPGFQRGVHSCVPSAISITQASELGTCYRAEEIAAISALAKKHKMKLHMDGARFANALAYLKCAPADITWRAGVDALSFGATKNGAFAAEAVVFFNKEDVRDFEYRRKRGGHLLSKMRFISAQLDAYLTDNRWLKQAARANALAARMAQGLAQVKGAELANPVEANAIFARLPDATIARLRDAGARFYDWAPPANGRTLVRLVLSFATPENDVAKFLEIASR